MSTVTTARQSTRTAGRTREAVDRVDERSLQTPNTSRTTTRNTTRTPGPERHHRSPVRRRGSRQQVTVRGRRVSVPTAAERSAVWTWIVLLSLAVAGVALAMYLSGKTTEQSFALSEAESTSTSLANELESLNRDVADASSTQRIAEEASRMGMVVPGQAGVLNVEGENIEELRAANPDATLPVTDVNGDVEAQGPTSDPEETGDVPGLAPHVLEEDETAGQGGGDDQPAGAGNGELPY